MTAHALPNRTPYRIVNLIGLGIVLSLLGDGTLYTVLPNPDIAAQAGLTLSMVGVLLGINRLVRLLFNPSAGILFDRMPRRVLLMGSMGLGALSTATYAATSGFGSLLVGRILWGAAWAGLWIGANTVVLDLAEAHNRGRLSARLQMWFFVGVGVASLTGGGFTDAFGFRNGLWLSAGVTASAALFWWIALPETRRFRHAKDTPEDQPEASSTERTDSRLIDVDRTGSTVQALRSIPWRLALPAAAPVFAIRFVFAGVIASTTILWLSAFVGSGLDLGLWVIPLASLTGAFSSVRTATSIGGAPLAGLISDRLGRRWPVMVGVLLIGAAGLGLMGTANIGWAVAGAMLAAVTSGSVQALSPAIAGDRVGEDKQSRALSVLFTIGDFGSALGPPLALGPTRGRAGARAPAGVPCLRRVASETVPWADAGASFRTAACSLRPRAARTVRRLCRRCRSGCS